MFWWWNNDFVILNILILLFFILRNDNYNYNSNHINGNFDASSRRSNSLLLWRPDRYYGNDAGREFREFGCHGREILESRSHGNGCVAMVAEIFPSRWRRRLDDEFGFCDNRAMREFAGENWIFLEAPEYKSPPDSMKTVQYLLIHSTANIENKRVQK